MSFNRNTAIRLFLAMAFVASTASWANAQLTAENLLKSSIEQLGPEHREIADGIEQFRKGNFLECRNLLKAARAKDSKVPPDGVLMAQMLYTANQPGLALSLIHI